MMVWAGFSGTPSWTDTDVPNLICLLRPTATEPGVSPNNVADNVLVLQW